MDYSLFDALWVAIIVLLTLWGGRIVAGVLGGSSNAMIAKIGTGLGSIVG